MSGKPQIVSITKKGRLPEREGGGGKIHFLVMTMKHNISVFSSSLPSSLSPSSSLSTSSQSLQILSPFKSADASKFSAHRSHTAPLDAGSPAGEKLLVSRLVDYYHQYDYHYLGHNVSSYAGSPAGERLIVSRLLFKSSVDYFIIAMNIIISVMNGHDYIMYHHMLAPPQVRNY